MAAPRRHTFRTLNNLKDVYELAPDEMSVAKNVDLHDDKHSVSRRPGFTKVLSASAHSFWATSDGSLALFGDGSSLKRFWPDGTVTTLVADLGSSDPIAFAEINNIVVYSNGSAIGLVQNGEASPLSTPTKQHKIPVVAGRFLEFYNGRMFVLNEDGLYYTDAYDIEQMDERNCLIPFLGKSNMLASVDDGLWASQGDKTFFLKGGNPEEFEYIEVDTVGAVAGTAVKTTGKKLLLDNAGKYVIWASPNGLCLGGNSGAFRNLTEDFLAVKPAQRGAGVLRESNGMMHYIAVLQDTEAERNKFTDPNIVLDSQTVGG